MGSVTKTVRLFYLYFVNIELNLPDSNAEPDIKKDIAVLLYDKEIYPLGKAAEFAGISKNDFMKLLREKKINIKYSIDDIKNDLSNLPEFALNDSGE
ncbi:MAG TPA: UPF0175 family protein [Parafilimonas sp.]|nr:UPF0175 family protein [Parafilimonas sp.]